MNLGNFKNYALLNMANNNILLSQSDYLVEVSYYVADNFKTIIIIKKNSSAFQKQCENTNIVVIPLVVLPHTPGFVTS